MFETLFSTAALILSSLHSKSGNYMEFQYAFGMTFLCVPTSLYFSRKLGVVFGIFATYASASAVSSAFNIYGRYATAPQEVQNVALCRASYALATSVIMFLAMIEMPPKWIRGIRYAFAIFTVSGALHVIRSYFFHYRLDWNNGYLGYLDYCGMTGVELALGCSFLIPKNEEPRMICDIRFLGLLLTIWAIILEKSMVPFLVLGMVLVCRAPFARFKWWPLPASLGIGLAVLGTSKITTTNRFQAYWIFIRELWHSGHFALGTGLGSFRVWSYYIGEKMAFFRNPNGSWEWYQWAHSDWIELCFELGVVGLILSALVYFQSLVRAYFSGDRELLSLGLGVLAATALDYPRQYFVTAFLVVFFVVESLRLHESKIQDVK